MANGQWRKLGSGFIRYVPHLHEEYFYKPPSEVVGIILGLGCYYMPKLKENVEKKNELGNDFLRDY